MRSLGEVISLRILPWMRMLRPPISEVLSTFMGLVEVPVNSRSRAECASRTLSSEERAEIAAWFTAAMIRRTNRVVNTNSLYCHIVQFNWSVLDRSEERRGGK